MYKVRKKICKDYSEMEVTGVRRPGMEHIDASKAWVEISEYCNDNKVEKLLVISRLTGELPLIKSYDIASSLELFGLRKDMKIAFVDVDIDANKTNSFSANTARNNGYFIHVFNEKDSAVKWLNKDILRTGQS